MKTVNNIILIIILFTFSALILSSCSQKNEDETIRPNIIFIFSDDLSYRDISCYGQEHFSTPNLDILAVNGLRFNNAYAGSPECAPSRGSIMTGMHMGHCRIRANRSARGQDHLEDEDITVAEVLKDAGYKTAFIGKWGIGLPGTEGTPDKQGFDYSYGYYDQARAHGFFPDYMMENGDTIFLTQNHGFNMRRVYQYNSRQIDSLDDVKNIYDENGILIPDGVIDPAKVSYSEDLFREAALKFISNNKDEPFFLYYATQLPHGPCIIPDLGEYRDRDWSLKNKEWAAMVSYMDRSVGAMVDLLNELGLIENSVIFFAGDNGYSQWGYFGRSAHEDDPFFHNKGPWPKGKFTCSHEGGMRVPFFVYWKDYIEPGRSGHLCALYDFFSTAADLAGTEEADSDGLSLLPTMLGNQKEQKNHDYFYWENGTASPHTQCVRMDNWWAFRNHPSEPVQLYDLANDLLCGNDLSEQNIEVVNRILEIFSEAHTDSEWYTNPGDPDELIKEKKQKASEEGTLQNSRGPNTLFNK